MPQSFPRSKRSPGDIHEASNIGLAFRAWWQSLPSTISALQARLEAQGHTRGEAAHLLSLDLIKWALKERIITGPTAGVIDRGENGIDDG